ncbi:hypothetical protein SLEP1_g15690 [Rubroshorea leprosula]|uniref:BAH domain-containing protein n=1 Tax=Rubroshorea leprosula TaxID=152421 RepID=A0AAV5INA9_9ROSI|nr:hypothetical protein SLEP1_g15690 [Rubroshorea leprosula]
MVDVENLEFKWGKKRGVGGKKRDVRFYESFTYDGEEYRLYDCVYFFKDDEPLPYIGKIIKIWENPDKTKKVKVVWFFQPHEITCYLAAEEALENELVLATGEGLGLTNINPLEAIAGKCNVVCISKDSRNRQPSIEERQLADYVFYQTFDVGQRTISDKIDEKIAGIEAKYFFNREGFLKPSADQKSGGAGKEDTIGKQIPEQPDGDMKVSLSVIHDKVAPVVQEVGSEIAGTDKKDSLSGLKSSSKIDSDVREGNKAKIDDSVKVPDEAKKINVQNFSRHDSDSNAAKALEPNVKASEDKSKLAKDSHGKVKSFLKELKTDDKLTKLGNGKLPKESSVQPPKDYKKSKKHALQSMGKLDFDRSKWFKELPWEERMKNAHEEGTLVLLQNLDPAYNSADVQDIVRQVFKETCTAKMFQRTAFSNPYYGQAFVIFKTREVAQMVVTRLDKGCLLLPNGRPLVASIANPSFPKKQSTFSGHLTLDKLKLQTQREMKEAVSTSHCSQPNTLEFDMAMEWCLLQERAECSWKKLFELQEKEYRKVKAELKSK